MQCFPLVDRKKILLPPIHIKLDLFKNFVKAIGKTNLRGFQYLVEKFPISAAILKEGIFVGLQIRDVLQDEGFEESLNVFQLNA